MSDPRQTPGLGSENDPNLGQKEAKQQKTDMENEDQERDEFAPMTEKSEPQPSNPQR